MSEQESKTAIEIYENKIIPINYVKENVQFPGRNNLQIYPAFLGDYIYTGDLDQLRVETKNRGSLTIRGNVGGYKTSIRAPNMDILIEGDVQTRGTFLYCVPQFRTLTIDGNVLGTLGILRPDVDLSRIVVTGKVNRRHNLDGETEEVIKEHLKRFRIGFGYQK